MHPTETCYGLAVDVCNRQALGKLYKLKGRDVSKPLSILVSDLKMARKYGVFSDKALELACKYWPGPLSIAVPRSGELPSFFNNGVEFASMRCSSDKFSSKLVNMFGSPITTTSANVSGKLPLYEVDDEVLADFGESVDLVVDGGEFVVKEPSTIVKVDGDKVEVLREGEILFKNL